MRGRAPRARTFIADCQRELPGEVIHITKEVNPANYDVTAIIKHLGAQKKFPIIIFDNPLNLNGKVGPIKLTKLYPTVSRASWVRRVRMRGYTFCGGRLRRAAQSASPTPQGLWLSSRR